MVGVGFVYGGAEVADAIAWNVGWRKGSKIEV